MALGWLLNASGLEVLPTRIILYLSEKSFFKIVSNSQYGPDLFGTDVNIARLSFIRESIGFNLSLYFLEN